MEILLDGNKILNKEMLFDTIKEQVKSADFYGSNLDALWDVLSQDIDNLVVTLKNTSELENNLGDYLTRLLNLFNDLNETAMNVRIDKS